MISKPRTFHHRTQNWEVISYSNHLAKWEQHCLTLIFSIIHRGHNDFKVYHRAIESNNLHYTLHKLELPPCVRVVLRMCMCARREYQWRPRKWCDNSGSNMPLETTSHRQIPFFKTTMDFNHAGWIFESWRLWHKQFTVRWRLRERTIVLVRHTVRYHHYMEKCMHTGPRVPWTHRQPCNLDV